FKILNDLEVNNLIHKNSICILGNYSQALAQGLPEHSAADIKRLIDASESCDDIVDFEPVIIRDVTGNEIRIESKNLARDYWMIAELLKNRPEIAKQGKKFEWINRMMQQIAWKIFEDEYGPSFYDKKTYKPTDSEVWQVIFGFHDYMDSLPAKLERDGIGVIFPYHDSNLLRNYIADKTNRTVALFYLADLPTKTVDKTTKQVITGINAMKKFVEQLEEERDTIISLNKQAKIDESAVYECDFPISYDKYKSLIKVISGVPSEDYLLARWYGWQWEGDRYFHGLPNTVNQFRNIDQFLTNNWKLWDLIKFIYGYESFKSAEWGGEWEMYRYGLPLAFKALGIPFGGIRINPDTYLINQGAPIYEWGVSLPDNIIERSKQTFLNYNIILDYGNIISLYSFVDGLLKDSDNIEYIMGGIRVPIYLWKK
ncbi:MAG: hypothetical protein QXI87_02730, partial [Thermoproteota archaeon]